MSPQPLAIMPRPRDGVAEGRPGHPSSWTLQAGPAAGSQATGLVKSGAEPGLAAPPLGGRGQAERALRPLLLLPAPSTTRPRGNPSQLFGNFYHNLYVRSERLRLGEEKGSPKVPQEGPGGVSR